MRRPDNFDTAWPLVVIALASAFSVSACQSPDEEEVDGDVPGTTGGAPAPYLPVDIDKLERFGPYLEGVVQIATNYRLSCAVHDDGRVSCWGEDYVGGLDAEPHRLPEIVEGIDNAREVIVTANTACAITTQGKVSCWGAGPAVNDADPDYPEYTPPTLIEGLNDVVRLSGDLAYVCALTADGHVGCFGRDNPSSEGRASSNAEVVPVDDLDGVRDIALVHDYYCQLAALHEDGKLECLSMSYEDADDTGEYVLDRRELPLENVTQVGGQCFVANQRAHCFGQSNVLGRPNEELDMSVDPVEIPGLDDVLQVWSNGGHACALKTTGEVHCWGSNRQGQIGQDFRSQVMTLPTQVPIATPAHQSSVGDDVSCALLDTGHVLCWGSNGSGEMAPVPKRLDT